MDDGTWVRFFPLVCVCCICCNEGMRIHMPIPVLCSAV